MSEKAVKATRRDIRKAFGPDALALIQKHGEQIAALQGNLALVQQFADDGDQAAMAAADGQLKDVWQLLREHEERLDAFTSRTLWHRLRWLFTGR